MAVGALMSELGDTGRLAGVEGTLELESLEAAEAVAPSSRKGGPVLRVRVGGGYDGLSVAVGERLCESLTDEVLVEGLVDSSGHLGDTWRGGRLDKIASQHAFLPQDAIS